MDLKKVKENKKLLIAIFSIAIIAVMFVPMLYSSIYLGSVWDVYGKLDSVPVAFVNLDKSVTKDGKEYAIGKEVEENLRDNNKLGWNFVSYEEAMDGVEGTKYYAVIEIPENFSENIADAEDGNFKNPEIIYIGNKGRNYIISQISSRVADGIKSEVNSSIQKEISKALVDNLYDVKVSIKQAGDGADELQSGEQKLLDGSTELSDGLQSAANGSTQLGDGLKLAADSTSKLKDGTQKLLNGSTDLSNGLGSAAGGSKQLLEGVQKLTDGQKQVVDGFPTLINGLKTLKSNLTKSNDQVPVLVKGASDLNTSVGNMAQGAAKLDSSFGTLAGAIQKADAALHEELAAIDNSNLSEADKIKIKTAIATLDMVNTPNPKDNNEVPLKKAANSIHNLAGGLQQVKTGTQKISDGVGSLSTGLANTQSEAAAGVDKLINGAESLQNGSNNIFNGLNTVDEKTGSLANGLDKLSSGSTTLKDGLKSVNDGNISLESGLNNAAEKTGELSEGLRSLSDGSNSLKDGLQSANDGAIKLRDGLNDGYNKMNDKLKFNSDNMSKFVSEPVSLVDKSINDIEFYGEGLAPYFISLSLWLGTMLISIILSIAKPLKVFQSKLMNNFIGRFAIGSLIVALQSGILSFTLIRALGANPTSIPKFYVINAFISVAFFAVMYGVSHAIGVLGGAVMFIVLLLQLASSGGTFPIESAPEFYRVINKIVPMTYSVSTLRTILSGTNQSAFSHNIVILLIFIIVSLCGGFVIRFLINLLKKKNQAIDNSQAV